ncbi:hypothetical protein ACFOWU_00965 [Epilithonimonas zeae]|nr:hypothetical protein [Epilithonimonas zeae]
MKITLSELSTKDLTTLAQRIISTADREIFGNLFASSFGRHQSRKY